VKTYTQAERLPQERIAEILSIKTSKVNEWLSKILEQEREEREAKILDMWLSCHTQEEIAAAVGMVQQDVFRFLGNLQKSFLG
jgi:hypothetical protein